MQIRRGTPPTHVERSVVCELEREEVLQILVNYIKQKLNNSVLKLDQISVVGSPDGELEAMTLTGVEIIALTWNEKKADTEEKKVTEPTDAPPAEQ